MKLKAQPGGDIVSLGGASITQAFIMHGLLDELQVLVHPAVIRSGRPLFGGIPTMRKLDFLWSQPFQSGTVAMCYQMNGKGE